MPRRNRTNPTRRPQAPKKYKAPKRRNILALGARMKPSVKFKDKRALAVEPRMSTKNTSKKQTTPEKIELSFRRSPEIKVVDSSEIAKMIANSIAMLDKIDRVNADTLNKVRAHSATMEDEYYDLGWGGIPKGCIKRDGWDTYDLKKAVVMREDYGQGNYGRVGKPKLVPDTVEAKRFDEFNKSSKYMRVRVEEFKKRFEKGILKQGDWFPHFINDIRLPGRPRNEWNTNIDMIVSVGIPDMAECDRCGDHITMKGLALHQKRVTCKDKAYRRKLEASGLQLVPHGSKVYNLAKRGLVPSELIATDYDAFVPNWVIRAEEMYNKAQKENGSMYAGMKLDEFLNKMRPADAVDDLSAQVEAANPKM